MVFGWHGNEVREIVNQARKVRPQMAWHTVVDRNNIELRIDYDRTKAEVRNILIVAYDSKEEKVNIGRGKNKGKKIVYRNVMKNVAMIGERKDGNITVSALNAISPCVLSMSILGSRAL